MIGRFLPLTEPAPKGPRGLRDGCRYEWPRGPCRAPRAGRLWCARHEAEWDAEVRAQGGAEVRRFPTAE